MAVGQEIASFFATIGADTRDFTKGLDETKKGMSGLEKTTNAIGGAAKLAMGVGVAAVAGFGAVVGKAVSSAMDFEQGVTDIGATMSLTAEDTAKLQDHIMDLGLDPKLKVSATEATEGIMALGTAGLSLDQIMGGASKATVQLSNATGGDMAKSASLMTDIMGQYGVTAEDTGQIVNQITGLTVASKFAFDDVALAFGQVGGVASSVGLSLEDTSAILGVTAKNFNSGSDAATSLKTMLTTLIPKSSEAEDVMASLGLVTTDYARMASDLSKVIGEEVEPSFMGVEEAFKKTSAGAAAAEKGNEALAKAYNGLKAQYQENQFFDDTTGAMKSASEIAGVLQGAFGGLSDQQRNEAASTIFGTDAMRTAFGLMDAGTPGINSMKEAIGKVDAEEIAAKRMDTFAGALEIAQGIIETLFIQIGQKFLPVLRPMVEIFSELAQTYGPKVVAFFGGLADNIAATIQPLADLLHNTEGVSGGLKQVWDGLNNVVSFLAAAIGPLATQIGKWVKWQDVLVAVGVFLAGPLLGALGGLIAAFAPVIATVGAVVLAVAALRNAWEHNFLGIRDIAKTVWNSIKDVIGGALTSIESWLRIHTNAWQGDWGSTLRYISEHSQEVWGDIVRYLQNAFDRMMSAYHRWADPMIRDITHWAEGVKGKFDWMVQWIIGDFGYWTRLIDYLKDTWQKLLDWWGDHIQPFVDKGMDMMQGLWDGAQSVWDRFRQWWGGLWEQLTGTVDVKLKIGSPSKVMEDRGMWIGEGLARGVENSLPMVNDAMNAMSAAAMGGGDYGYSMAGGSSTPQATSTARIEELLTILIQELRAKSMTANVTVAGGGMGYGDLVGATAGLR